MTIGKHRMPTLLTLAHRYMRKAITVRSKHDKKALQRRVGLEKIVELAHP